MFAQSLNNIKKGKFHETFQLVSAVVRLKGLDKVPFFVSNKDRANTILEIN